MDQCMELPVRKKDGTLVCEPCEQCHAGLEPTPPCGQNVVLEEGFIKDCTVCPKGMYKETVNDIPNKLPCKSCKDVDCHGFAEERECTQTSATVCSLDKCDEDHHTNEDGHCIPCCKCLDSKERKESKCLKNLNARFCPPDGATNLCKSIKTTTAAKTTKIGSKSTKPKEKPLRTRTITQEQTKKTSTVSSTKKTTSTKRTRKQEPSSRPSTQRIYESNHTSKDRKHSTFLPISHVPKRWPTKNLTSPRKDNPSSNALVPAIVVPVAIFLIIFFVYYCIRRRSREQARGTVATQLTHTGTFQLSNRNLDNEEDNNGNEGRAELLPGTVATQLTYTGTVQPSNGNLDNEEDNNGNEGRAELLPGTVATQLTYIGTVQPSNGILDNEEDNNGNEGIAELLPSTVALDPQDEGSPRSSNGNSVDEEAGEEDPLLNDSPSNRGKRKKYLTAEEIRLVKNCCYCDEDAGRLLRNVPQILSKLHDMPFLNEDALNRIYNCFKDQAVMHSGIKTAEELYRKVAAEIPDVTVGSFFKALEQADLKGVLAEYHDLFEH